VEASRNQRSVAGASVLLDAQQRRGCIIGQRSEHGPQVDLVEYLAEVAPPVRNGQLDA
jgi:hypothetical protein